MISIKTNKHWYDIYYGFELSEKDLADYTHVTNYKELKYFRYRKYLYLLDDFMRVEEANKDLAGWDGYMTDTYFSGVAVKLNKSGEKLQVATFFYKE